ncbi:MAG: insulinase family protein [bacterium]|nr:insulinase family protein [bacterium]
MKHSHPTDGFHRTVLTNGLRVVTEELPDARSISLGIFVEVGSRDEPAEFAGIAHFIEHMAFKGTKRRTPRQISMAIEETGGGLNAFTGREITGFHATVLSSEFATAVDVLTDIVANSTFPEKELEKEKGVVNDELRGVQETPDDLIFELWQEDVFPNHPLGRSILGMEKTLDKIDRNHLIEFVAKHYHPKRMVVAAAGNCDHDELCRMIEQKIPFQNNARPPVRNASPKLEPQEGKTQNHPSENAHLVMGLRAYSYGDKRKLPLLLLNTVLGAGMSSRLFQEIRERRGIAYNVYSFFDSYRDCGLFGIYLGTVTPKLETARAVALAQLEKIATTPLTSKELKRSKTQLKGGIILALESTASRMSRLARMELYQESYLSIDDVALKIDAVTAEEILTVAQDLWGDGKPFTETRLLPIEKK